MKDDLQLYCVHVEYDTYVMAQNALDAEQTACGYDVATSDTFYDNTDAHAVIVAAADVVPAEWIDSIPFGSEDDKTIRQILEVK